MYNIYEKQQLKHENVKLFSLMATESSVEELSERVLSPNQFRSM